MLTNAELTVEETVHPVIWTSVIVMAAAEYAYITPPYACAWRRRAHEWWR
jgi:hypothetical protein